MTWSDVVSLSGQSSSADDASVVHCMITLTMQAGGIKLYMYICMRLALINHLMNL